MDERVHKSLFRDLWSMFQDRRPSETREGSLSGDEFASLVTKYREQEGAEDRAHIDLLTNIVLDLTNQLNKERDLIASLYADLDQKDVEIADLRRGRKTSKRVS